MKFSLLTAVQLSLLLAPLSLAAPTIVNGVESIGAAFTMTNHPTGNYLIALSIAKDGTLSFDNVLPTGGTGLQGLNAPIGDPLFSQGSIQINYRKNLLVNTNAGSNTLTLWRVDPTNPLNISVIGKPVYSGGDFPISATFNRAGDRLCALNTGIRNGFMCFLVDTEKGLIPIPSSFRPLGLIQTYPAMGPPNSASQIKFSPDETKIYVTSKGSRLLGTRGFLGTWDVDLKSAGTVTVAQTNNKVFTEINLRPLGMAFINGRNGVVTGDSQVGMDIFDLDKGTVLTVPIPNNGDYCWAMYSKKTDRYYFVPLFSATIAEVQIDSTKEILNGGATRLYPKIPGNMADPDLITIGSNDYLMTFQTGNLLVYVDNLRGPEDAVPVQTFDLSIVSTISGVPLDRNHTIGFIAYLNHQYAPASLL